ncbi:MAG: hypothetical protein KAI22_11805, partial [Gammaproteobacteria bacterium]|nr:hypothetical protein [Gammaproteobacteria bacterium]
LDALGYACTHLTQEQEQGQGQGQEQEQDKDNKFSTADTEKQQEYADKTVEKTLQKKAETKSEVPPAQASLSKDKLSPEERQSVENWLRRVPDDPGGLLRRKFLYQYQQRRQQYR